MKKYTLTLTQNDKGALNVETTNDGFNPLELLGLLSWKHNDVQEQLKGHIVPDTVSRTVIED